MFLVCQLWFLRIYSVWVCSVSCNYRIVSFATFEGFSAIIPLITFSAPLSSSSPSGALMWTLNLLLLSPRSQRLCSFFLKLFSLCWSKWRKSIYASSGSLILSCHLHPTIELIQWVFFKICDCILKFYNAHWFFFFFFK